MELPQIRTLNVNLKELKYLVYGCGIVSSIVNNRHRELRLINVEKTYSIELELQ